MEATVVIPCCPECGKRLLWSAGTRQQVCVERECPNLGRDPR